MKAFVTGGSGFLGRELIRALVAQHHEVRALARSEKAAAAVRACGAEPVSGDLDGLDAMKAGMQGCDRVFHCAAHVEEWDTDEAFWRINVTGTENTLAAAKAMGVKRFVLISTEAVLADGRPIIRADETTPLPHHPLPGYPRTKQAAEQRVREASGPAFETVVVRPRFIWGRRDTALLPRILEAQRRGRFRWIGGGRHLSSSCHVANVVEGALLAAEKGTPAAVYFLTDGEPVEFRSFVSQLFESQQRPAPTGSIPHGLAWTVAVISETLWRRLELKGAPPVTRVAVGLLGHEVTVSDAKARRELGYQGKMSVADGLAELRRLPPVVPL